MTADPVDQISELAERLKNAAPLESPAIAEQLNQLVEAIGPQLADSVRWTKAVSAIANDPIVRQNLEQVANASRQIQLDRTQLARIATEFQRLQDSGVLDQVAAAARQIQIDQAQFAQIAAEFRRLQESGFLDQIHKYQQQLAELAASVRKITEG